MERQWMFFLAIIGSLGCSPSNGSDSDATTDNVAEGVTTLQMKPTGGLGVNHADSNVCGGSRYQCVDDGTSFAAADGDATYVYSTAAGGSHKTSYSGAPAGTVTQVVTHVVAAAQPGASGTATVRLYDSGKLIGTGSPHPLSATYSQYNDAFDVSAASANKLQTRVTFSSANLKYTEIWMTVSLNTASPHSVLLQWVASMTPGVTYNVYRGTAPGGPYQSILSGINATQATDAVVGSSTTYYYVVRSADANGESVNSNEVQAVIP